MRLLKFTCPAYIRFMRFMRFAPLLALCATCFANAASPATNWMSFLASPEAKRPLLYARTDTNLLARAVFHITNHHRKTNNLPEIKYNEAAAKAAAIQSRIMRDRGSISHENPEVPQFETLKHRADHAGLTPRFLAENVATASELAHRGGTVYKREVRGQTTWSLTPQGPAIPRHTYASFARMLVERWMDSPGHRKNILSTNAAEIGVSCIPEERPQGLATFYCTQVFYTPL